MGKKKKKNRAVFRQLNTFRTKQCHDYHEILLNRDLHLHLHTMEISVVSRHAKWKLHTKKVCPHKWPQVEDKSKRHHTTAEQISS